jgi:hypothetical protein
MNEPQPQLPFGEQNTLEEIRRLLETQTELLRVLVDRLGDPRQIQWAPQHALCGEAVEEEAMDELLDDEEFWEEAFDDEEQEEELPDPPVWFAQHYPWE